MKLALLITHWCRHCGAHLQQHQIVKKANEGAPCCPACFTTELDELKELDDEQ